MSRAFRSIIFAAGSLSAPGQIAGGPFANAVWRCSHAPDPWRDRPCRDVLLRRGAPWQHFRDVRRLCYVRL